MGGVGLLPMVGGVAATLVALVVLRKLLAREPDPVIARVVALALVAKVAGTIVFHFVLVGVYDAGGDTQQYFRRGTELAGQIRSGSLPEQATQTGTAFMDFLAGATLAVVGPNQLAANLVFSLMAFVGMYLFLQAFRLAVPDGHHRRYALLVLFLPTMVFWSSTLGKEAWLVLTLGVCAYGAARVLRRERFGALFLVAGISGAFAMRPHMAALVAVAFALSYLLRFRDPDVRKGLASWLVGFLVIGAGVTLVLINYSEEVARGEPVETTGAERVREETQRLFTRTEERTSRGGSEFDSRSVRGPGDFGHAVVTVTFRPFPTEAHNRVAQLASLESVFLFLMVVVSGPRLLSLPSAALRRPYVALAGAYTVGFIIAFSNMGNFGILVRQRVQLLPFVLVLLCVPVAAGARSGRRALPAVPPVPSSESVPTSSAGSAQRMVRLGNGLPDARSRGGIR